MNIKFFSLVVLLCITFDVLGNEDRTGDPATISMRNEIDRRIKQMRELNIELQIRGLATLVNSLTEKPNQLYTQQTSVYRNNCQLAYTEGARLGVQGDGSVEGDDWVIA